MIFNYNNYKKYLNNYIISLPVKGYGIKSDIAKKINCQTTYVSRVLSDKGNFSLEQAEKLSEYWASPKILDTFLKAS